MPLHLLGKKSWHVYNGANVDRVRRDEADARAREEAAEQRMQEEDAARRVAILRGEQPAPVPETALSPQSPLRYPQQPNREDGAPPERKRRRLRGEDDTDRDIRLAREAEGAVATALVKHRADDAPLHDDSGHIQLVPAPDESTVRRAERAPHAEAEKVKKRGREDEQGGMHFSDAAGRHRKTQRPWYVEPVSDGVTTGPSDLAALPDKDVWGNDDPRRKDRERLRVVSSDPLAAMQQAQRQLKQSVADQKVWKEERIAELEGNLRTEDGGQRHRKRHRHREDDSDGLNGFSLDSLARVRRESSSHDKSRRHRHHRSERSSRARQ